MLSNLLASRKKIILSSIILFVVFASIQYSSKEVDDVDSTQQQQIADIKEAYPVEQAKEFKIKKGQSFFDLLISAGVQREQTNAVVEKARTHVDFKYLMPGQKYYAMKNESDDLKWLRLELSPVKYIVFEKNLAEAWDVKQVEEEVKVRLLNFSGKVESSLWESAIAAEMDPTLIAELTEIFAWQVDFAREVRSEDKWRLTVEQKMARDKHVGWGRIVAAEYDNAGEVYSAVLFRKDSDDIGYFMPSGESLKRMFLKSPVRFSRISSRFNRRRFHPILKRVRPHLGVDYAAKRGTPVRAVGEGVVRYARRTRGGGNTIKIHHNSVYRTHYKHLHGFAKGVREGRKVKQGQIIGYVGSTGLSTGPHLHFEFYENGRYVDPQGKKFPSADPVKQQWLAEFQSKSKLLLGSLPSWGLPMRLPAGGFEIVSRELTEQLNRDVLEN